MTPWFFARGIARIQLIVVTTGALVIGLACLHPVVLAIEFKGRSGFCLKVWLNHVFLRVDARHAPRACVTTS